jgi:hypothetical protein
VRRPHPRFDNIRDAWVTQAGGKLKILAKGPKTAETEAAAWDAFYVHIAKLGTSVEGSSLPTLTLGQLADKYGDWMQREVEAGRMRPRTLDYYKDQLQKFLDALGGHRPALGVLPHEVEMYKTGWHSVQAVQRLYNWAVKMGLLAHNPLRSIQKPDPGQRQRILSPVETVQLLRATDRDFRRLCNAIRENGKLAKPGSYPSSPSCHFRQWHYKATSVPSCWPCSTPLPGPRRCGPSSGSTWSTNRCRCSSSRTSRPRSGGRTGPPFA